MWAQFEVDPDHISNPSSIKWAGRTIKLKMAKTWQLLGVSCIKSVSSTCTYVYIYTEHLVTWCFIKSSWGRPSFIPFQARIRLVSSWWFSFFHVC